MDASTRNSRISLTKAQIQEAIGAELLALCQSVTEDGTLSKEEIVALASWLKENRSADLPAISFLSETVERIIADKRVTREEQKELYQAIEKILPPEARKDAIAQRKMVENKEKTEERAKAKARVEMQKQEKREERKRNQPVFRANFMLAGGSYEGRGNIIRQYVREDSLVYLARDRQNRFSRNAIEVRIENGMHIGYVPEEHAEDMAPILDEGAPHEAYVSKILGRGHTPIPVIQAYLYQSDADAEGLVFESDVPAKVSPSSISPKGLIAFCFIAICLFLILRACIS